MEEVKRGEKESEEVKKGREEKQTYRQTYEESHEAKCPGVYVHAPRPGPADLPTCRHITSGEKESSSGIESPPRWKGVVVHLWALLS